ncbi:uncharacterized protein LOC123530136 isoform X2 [Mercenaria mercenaria]|uniref:uncharacterized protein LOC123530136 isoform X2 n=1 Tax=Mercenaria mercenaria TaxID=6596 RepID=UPI00234F6874|nr:uncharacterized protein LOC123530136 isoform X2 [Mercenaria mercenaria]
MGTLQGLDSKRTKRKWNFSTLNELHDAANSLLRQAMLNERYKRWKKVVSLYEELLWMIDLERFPDDYEPPSIYFMLRYELHFHLGVALQHLGKHTEAVLQFSKTIEVVSIAKNGCLAGCLTNSCLMTPIYTRRAFAHSKLGSYKLALKDAEKAVVLDSGSPDVYCIRALVRSTFDDELMGLKDLESALKLDPDHVCATMLKASFTKPLVTDENEQYGFFGKAVRLCQESETYLTCNSFIHPCIVEFYDKFLFPLSIPHTVTCIHLTPEKPTKKQLESGHTDSAGTDHSSRPTTSTSRGSKQSSASTEVFRCGTTNVASNNRISFKRRTDYGNAIRKYMSRPKSAQDFFAQLEKQRRYDKIRKRAQSALLRPGERFVRYHSTPCPDTEAPVKQSELKQKRPVTAPVDGRLSTLSTIRGGSPEKMYGSPATFLPMHHYSPEKECPTSKNEGDVVIDKPPRPKTRKKILIEAPKDYVIPVFQSVNIKDAPRMYYKPWGGDKLPVAERTTFKYSPAFY